MALSQPPFLPACTQTGPWIVDGRFFVFRFWGDDIKFSHCCQMFFFVFFIILGRLGFHLLICPTLLASFVPASFQHRFSIELGIVLAIICDTCLIPFSCAHATCYIFKNIVFYNEFQCFQHLLVSVLICFWCCMLFLFFCYDIRFGIDYLCVLASILIPFGHPFGINFLAFWWSNFHWFFWWYIWWLLLTFAQKWFWGIMDVTVPFRSKGVSKTHQRHNFDLS